jgi:hypothetical protein
MRRVLPPVAVLALVLAVPPGASAVELVRFDSCRELTRFARTQALRTGGTTGVPFRGALDVAAPLREPVSLPPRGVAGAVGPGGPIPAPAVQSAAPAREQAGEPYSATNVQEAGVDEADLLKTDGRRLYLVVRGLLRIYDVRGTTPRLAGTLAVEGGGHQLLVRGTRVLVLANGPAGVLLTEVDATDATAPRIARTMELAGRLVGARLTEGTARVVVASSPEPIRAPGPVALRGRLARTPTTQWLPRTTIRSRISGRTFRRSVVPCARVRRPQAFSGLDLLSVLTVDLDRGLYSVARQAVMAGAQDVYASPTSLVVASRRWVPGTADGTTTEGGVTELHLFEAGAEPRTAYRASGTVRGFVLNQFAISEHEGHLRVATTEDAPWTPGGGGGSQSGVSVLRADGERLATVGRVTGLGVGERIFGVRFLGDRGYVVTFRQIDPLYVVDLADPAAPRVRGELKITGYSAYLHPVSPTRLLGVGQDATEQGARLGAQLSLFDVGDPAQPRLLDRASVPGWAAAERDHRAFLWWAPAGLTVVPIDDYASPSAVAFRIGSASVTEAGRIAHPAPSADRTPPPIGRSLAIGDRLLTVSASGIATNRLSDLAPLDYTPLT